MFQKDCRWRGGSWKLAANRVIAPRSGHGGSIVFSRAR